MPNNHIPKNKPSSQASGVKSGAAANYDPNTDLKINAFGRQVLQEFRSVRNKISPVANNDESAQRKKLQHQRMLEQQRVFEPTIASNSFYPPAEENTTQISIPENSDDKEKTLKNLHSEILQSYIPSIGLSIINSINANIANIIDHSVQLSEVMYLGFFPKEFHQMMESQQHDFIQDIQKSCITYQDIKQSDIQAKHTFLSGNNNLIIHLRTLDNLINFMHKNAGKEMNYVHMPVARRDIPNLIKKQKEAQTTLKIQLQQIRTMRYNLELELAITKSIITANKQNKLSDTQENTVLDESNIKVDFTTEINLFYPPAEEELAIILIPQTSHGRKIKLEKINSKMIESWMPKAIRDSIINDIDQNISAALDLSSKLYNELLDGFFPDNFTSIIKSMKDNFFLAIQKGHIDYHKIEKSDIQTKYKFLSGNDNLILRLRNLENLLNYMYIHVSRPEKPIYIKNIIDKTYSNKIELELKIQLQQIRTRCNSLEEERAILKKFIDYNDRFNPDENPAEVVDYTKFYTELDEYKHMHGPLLCAMSKASKEGTEYFNLYSLVILNRLNSLNGTDSRKKSIFIDKNKSLLLQMQQVNKETGDTVEDLTRNNPFFKSLTHKPGDLFLKNNIKAIEKTLTALTIDKEHIKFIDCKESSDNLIINFKLFIEGSSAKEANICINIAESSIDNTQSAAKCFLGFLINASFFCIYGYINFEFPEIEENYTNNGRPQNSINQGILMNEENELDVPIKNIYDPVRKIFNMASLEQEDELSLGKVITKSSDDKAIEEYEKSEKLKKPKLPMTSWSNVHFVNKPEILPDGSSYDMEKVTVPNNNSAYRSVSTHDSTWIDKELDVSQYTFI